MKKQNLIIPAAGIGKRLQPLTKEIPKSMVQVGRRTILEHQLNVIPVELVKRLIIITGYKGDVLREFVDSLDLPYPVTFYKNEHYRNTHCTYSLLKAHREMQEGFVYINADLLFAHENLMALLESEYPDAICTKNIRNYKTDLQQVRIATDKIIEWKLKTEKPNDGEVMGPLKLSAESARIVVSYCDSLSLEELSNLPCFTMFSLLLGQIDYHAVFLKNDKWCEIDTLEDLEKATQTWATV